MICGGSDTIMRTRLGTKQQFKSIIYIQISGGQPTDKLMLFSETKEMTPVTLVEMTIQMP
jgi:hypothetical protein